MAAFAATLAFEDLPGEAVNAVKRMVLDSLGVALAATTLGDGCRETIAVMRGLGGPTQSTILGTDAKVAAPNAAFANGALVHALNYDPIGAGIGHQGVVCLVAPLAVAESVGGVSGREFIAAAAVACEITARITAAITAEGRRLAERHLAGQLLSYFGAAAGAGRILRLTPAQMRSAFGLALMQAAGSRQVVLSGDPPVKAIYGAFPNQAGVQAALLSQAGLGADIEVLGPPAGLYAMVHGGHYDPAVLCGGLGAEFRLSEAQIKPWPASNHVHPFIEAASEIARDGIDAAQIDAVAVVAPSELRPWCEPLDKRRRPDTAAAASNSIPFCVAKILARGDLVLGDLAPQGLNDAAALAIAARTTYRLEDGIAGGTVELRLRDGRKIERHVTTPLGDRSRPVSHERVLAKFRDCCTHAASPLDGRAVERLIDTIDNLENVDDVARLARLAANVSV